MTEATAVATTGSRRRRAAPADIACSAGLAGGLVASYVLAALTPSLLRHHVVLLEALAGSIVAIVTGGAFARVGDAPLALVVLAPLCGIALYDVFLWWAGRRWGTRLADMYTRRRPRAARAVTRAEALVRRRGLLALALAYYLPIPNAFVYLACGTSEMPLWTFVLGDAIGTVLWVALLVGLGWAMGHDAVRFVTTVDHHATEATLAVIALFVVVRLVMRVRRRRVGDRATGASQPSWPADADLPHPTSPGGTASQ